MASLKCNKEILLKRTLAGKPADPRLEKPGQRLMPEKETATAEDHGASL